MTRSHALALSSAAVFLSLSIPSYAQALRPGQQCQPAVANASMYGNCRLALVRGQEVCRCAVRPRALGQLNRGDRGDRGDMTTGSVGIRGVLGSSGWSTP